MTSFTPKAFDDRTRLELGKAILKRWALSSKRGSTGHRALERMGYREQQT